MWTVRGLPEQWTVTAVRYRGLDVTDKATRFASTADSREFEIIVSPRSARLVVRATGADATASARVVIFSGTGQWPRSRNPSLFGPRIPRRGRAHARHGFATQRPRSTRRFETGGTARRCSRRRTTHDRGLDYIPGGAPVMVPLFFLLLSLAGQSTPPPEPGITLRGRVTTRKPAGDCLAHGSAPTVSGGSTQLQVDDRGEFEFTRLSPGPYTLVAAAGEFRSTHVTTAYQRPGARPGDLLLLRAGDVLTNVEIALPARWRSRVAWRTSPASPLANVVMHVQVGGCRFWIRFRSAPLDRRSRPFPDLWDSGRPCI